MNEAELAAIDALPPAALFPQELVIRALIAEVRTLRAALVEARDTLADVITPDSAHDPWPDYDDMWKVVVRLTEALGGDGPTSEVVPG